jgi:hypothetical protein
VQTSNAGRTNRRHRTNWAKRHTNSDDFSYFTRSPPDQCRRGSWAESSSRSSSRCRGSPSDRICGAVRPVRRRLRALEDPVNETRGAAEQVAVIGGERHQSPLSRKDAKGVHRRQSSFRSQRDEMASQRSLRSRVKASSSAFPVVASSINASIPFRMTASRCRPGKSSRSSSNRSMIASDEVRDSPVAFAAGAAPGSRQPRWRRDRRRRPKGTTETYRKGG